MGLIRLSTAHAKARLSKTVEAEDADAAIELVQFAYFKKVLNKPKKRRHKSGEEGEEGEEGEVEGSKPRLDEFMTELFAVFEKDRSQVLSMDLVRKEIIGGKGGFTAAELAACIEKMTEMNKVMMASNELYLI